MHESTGIKPSTDLPKYHANPSPNPPRILSWQESEVIERHIDNLRHATREEIIEAILSQNYDEKGALFLLQLFATTNPALRNDAQKKLIANGRNYDVSIIKEKVRKSKGLKNLFIDEKLAPWGSKEQDKWILKNRHIETSANNLPEYSVLHAKALEISEKTSNFKVEILLKALANQYLGVNIKKLLDLVAISETAFIRLIEDINSGLLLEHNIKIHIRNGIAILGPIREDNRLTIINTRENRTGFLEQDQILAELENYNNTLGPNIRIQDGSFYIVHDLPESMISTLKREKGKLEARLAETLEKLAEASTRIRELEEKIIQTRQKDIRAEIDHETILCETREQIRSLHEEIRRIQESNQITKRKLEKALAIIERLERESGKDTPIYKIQALTSQDLPPIIRAPGKAFLTYIESNKEYLHIKSNIQLFHLICTLAELADNSDEAITLEELKKKSGLPVNYRLGISDIQEMVKNLQLTVEKFTMPIGPPKYRLSWKRSERITILSEKYGHTGNAIIETNITPKIFITLQKANLSIHKTINELTREDTGLSRADLYSLKKRLSEIIGQANKINGLMGNKIEAYCHLLDKVIENSNDESITQQHLSQIKEGLK